MLERFKKVKFYKHILGSYQSSFSDCEIIEKKGVVYFTIPKYSYEQTLYPESRSTFKSLTDESVYKFQFDSKGRCTKLIVNNNGYKRIWEKVKH